MDKRDRIDCLKAAFFAGTFYGFMLLGLPTLVECIKHSFGHGYEWWLPVLLSFPITFAILTMFGLVEILHLIVYWLDYREQVRIKKALGASTKGGI